MGKTNSDIQKLIASIRELRKQNKTDEQIKQILKLHPRTFQRYNVKIRQTDRAIWFSMTRHELEPLLVKFLQSLEDIYIRAEKLANAENTEGETVLNALEVMAQTRSRQVQLLTEGGPEIISSIEQQQQLPHQDKKIDYASLAARAYKQHQEQRHP